MSKYVICLCIIAITISNCEKKHIEQREMFDVATVKNMYRELNKAPLTAAPNRSTDTYYVDMLTGFITITDDDILLPGLQFTRYYNPMFIAGSHTMMQSERWKNPCGYGWQYSYNIYLRLVEQVNSPTDTIRGLAFHEANNMDVFILLPNGHYRAKEPRHDNLVKINDGWQLYKSNGDIYYFGPSRKVDSIVDRHGGKTTFAYTGNYLTALTGTDKSMMKLWYDSDSLLRWLLVQTDTSAALIEYQYTPVMREFPTDTFSILGMYFLTQVIQHELKDSAKSHVVLYRYYYEKNGIHMLAKTIPRTTLLQSDTTWQNNWKTGDRLYMWYNQSTETIYHEIVEDDGDTLLANDNTAYRAYTQFFRRGSAMDSAFWYSYPKEARTGPAHNPYDTSFTPYRPQNYRLLEKRDYHTDWRVRQIFVEKRKPSGECSITKYYKDSHYNDTMIVLPSHDTLRYSYKSYFLDETTQRHSKYPTKIMMSSGDSMLFYYHAPDTNAPSFFMLDSIGGMDLEGRDYFDESIIPDSSRFY
ncbi:hypothetical protein AMJ87_11930 [candidate division WOR_3 bacterium SM23_60]|uniref:Uncharacterized protein n=1 Tax=candidate division WOR_3 bacterium SM23_60 TaxID=1703780 RepID=A0A0S8G765_UNCW3|nr:MAG: hypothetical protein AMJ87_11930 [candidate division WOR_3 bacterium SM23_60]